MEVEHGTYAHASEDGCSVRLDARRASHNAVWAVQRRYSAGDGEGPGTLYVLQDAYGRYLGRPDALCCPFPCSRFAIVQRDFDKPEIQAQAIKWRAVATSGDAILLHDASGRYLRANKRCLPCRTGVWVFTCGSPWTAKQWALEAVPRCLGRPERPFVSDLDVQVQSKWAKLHAPKLHSWVCPPLSRLYQQWSLEREIWWVLADDSSNFSEEWRQFQTINRSMFILEKTLDNRLGLPMPLCVVAGRYGQRRPLSINLPHNQEPLYIMVFRAGTTANAKLVYPDVNEEITGREMRRLGGCEGQGSSEDTRPADMQSNSRSAATQGSAVGASEEDEDLIQLLERIQGPPLEFIKGENRQWAITKYVEPFLVQWQSKTCRQKMQC